MATAIFTSFNPILDSNGDPVSGAKIQVYDAGTTTPRAIYSDTALSVAVSNPIRTNSGGYTTTDGGTTPGVVYTAAGSYKVVVTTSADVAIPGYTRDNIDGGVPVGSGALAIANGGTGATTAETALVNLGAADQSTLDDLATEVAALTGASESNEKTHLATGTTAQRPATPAEGDVRRNTTTSRWEGYNNSAAWETFFTNTEIASSGDATTGTDNTKVMTAARVKSSIDTFSGWVLIDAKDASGATVELETGIGSTYEAYEIRFSNFKPATDDVALWMRIGTGGTPTYQSGGSDYQYQFTQTNPGAATSTVYFSTGAAQMLLVASGTALGVGNASGEHISGAIRFDNPESSSDFQIFRCETSFLNAGGNFTHSVGGGKYNSATAVTAIRLLFSSGNISSGRIALYGLRRA